jgi:hypothetical protein
MLRFLVRAFGLILLTGGFAAFIIDGTRSIAASSITMARFGDLCAYLFPKLLPQLQPAIERNLHPLLWDPVLRGFFLVPGWIVLSAFGLLLIWLARRRRGMIGHSSRP